MTSKRASFVVLISGSGSNLQAIIDAVKNGEIKAEISAVISNRADAGGLKRAQNAGIDTFVIDHNNFKDRESFDHALMHCIDKQQPDLIILAGFMRILSDAFIQHYQNRLLNIHPSLLPHYKGLNTHQRVLDAGDKKHGATVHMVSAELDSGSMVIQAEVPVLPEDSRETLAQRVLTEEHKIYPLAISLILDGRLLMTGDTPVFDGKPLTRPLLWNKNQLMTP